MIPLSRRSPICDPETSRGIRRRFVRRPRTRCSSARSFRSSRTRRFSSKLSRRCQPLARGRGPARRRVARPGDARTSSSPAALRAEVLRLEPRARRPRAGARGLQLRRTIALRAGAPGPDRQTSRAGAAAGRLPGRRARAHGRTTMIRRPRARLQSAGSRARTRAGPHRRSGFRLGRRVPARHGARISRDGAAVGHLCCAGSTALSCARAAYPPSRRRAGAGGTAGRGGDDPHDSRPAPESSPHSISTTKVRTMNDQLTPVSAEERRPDPPGR